MPHTLVLQLIFEQQNLCYAQYVIVVFACPVPGCMPRRVTSSDGGGRLDILLSLRIGGGACPAGGVGDFTTCLLLGACTLHCFLIRTSALDAHDLFEHGTL